VNARGAAAAAGTLLLAGCASLPAGGPAVPHDPWEAWNRKVFAFNEVVDNAVMKPVATAYQDIVPQLVRTGVTNVLDNIRDVWSAANHLLQGKVQGTLETTTRVLVNTFFGLGGLLDPATEMRLPRQREDFGQTLGVWGVGNGPYMVLPFLGPFTVRDSVGLLADREFAPASLATTDAGKYAVATLELVDLRANLLGASRMLDQVALDKYSFMRDAYLSVRRNSVYDGAPPLDAMDDESDAAAPPAAAASAASASQ
jgi:phospholipid-binding lipoprotein MlaA